MRKQQVCAQALVYLGFIAVPGVLLAQGLTSAAQGASFSSNKSAERSLDSPTSGSASAEPADSLAGVPASIRIINSPLKTGPQLHTMLDSLTKLLDQYRADGNRHEEANVLCAMAAAYSSLHEQQRALEFLSAALVLWKAIGEKAREAETLSQIGDVYRDWGFAERAVTFYRQSLAAFSATNDRAGKAAAMNGLAIAYLSLRDKKKALDYLNRTLVAYRENHDGLGEARAMSNLGATYFSLVHDPARAITTLQDAVTRLEILNDSANEANALEIMGMAWESLGKPELASVEFQRALMLFHQIGRKDGENSIRRQLELLKEPSS